MNNQNQVISGFLAACPSLARGWDHRLRPEDVQGDAPDDITYIGDHLANCYARGEFAEFPAAFAFLEQCFGEGSEEVRRSCVFLLYPLWLRLRGEPGAKKAFEDAWLGPFSKVAWELCEEIERICIKGLAPFLTHLRGKSAQSSPEV
jgi:hypothetical protein